MQQRYTRGKTRLKNEDGTVLVIAVFLVMLFAILFAGMVQLGIYLLARDQLQTATDAAALAGASSGAERYVTIKVVTDKGSRRVCHTDCDTSGNCNTDCGCTNCGQAEYTVSGSEKMLLDEEGWKDYCVPTCSGCGGDKGECWYELEDRNMTYEIQSMQAGMSDNTLAKVEADLIATTVSVIAETATNYADVIHNMLDDLSLTQIYNLLKSEDKFLRAWQSAEGYSPYCQYECPSGNCDECFRWSTIGKEVFDIAKTHKDMVNDSIKAISSMRNSQGVPEIDKKYTEAAGKFFEANLPKNASDAGIQKITVYSYNPKYNSQNQSPYYPSVVVYATAKIKTLFPSLFPNDLQTTVCASGATSFRDSADQTKNGNKFYDALTGGKWYKVPEDGCWVDW